MPATGREMNVRLYRDGLSTPWGFRLHGGTDVKAPLCVHKVSVGSPADGELVRGDVILEIQGCDATQMTHSKAQEMIRNAGGSMALRLRRSGHQQNTAPMPSSTAMPVGPQDGMLGRVQNTLTNKVYTPDDSMLPYSGYGEYPYYPSHYPSYSSFSPNAYNNTTELFSHPTSPVVTEMRRKTQEEPKRVSSLFEPGWVARPRMGAHPVRAPRHVAAPVNSATHLQYPRPSGNDAATNQVPAWAGSLKSVGGVHAADTYAAEFIGQATERNGSAGARSPGNLQYNTPIALYSRSNAQQALDGKPKHPFDIQAVSDSDVYRLVHEEGRQQRQRPKPSPRHLHPGPADTVVRQSPSMYALQAQYGVEVDNVPGDYSDF